MSTAKYEFSALTREGTTQSGVMEAASWADAHKRMLTAGLTPVKLRVARKGWKRFTGRRARVTLKELSQFTHQFAVLTEARIPLSEGLRSIAAEESNSALQRIVESIGASIGTGSTITESMEPHASVFGDVYIETVRAAEKSGNLTAVLHRLSQTLEDEIDRRAGLRAMLLYPACVVTALVLAVVFLLTVVVPRFVGVFQAAGGELPLPTRLLIAMSEGVRGYWWAGLIGVGALWTGLNRYQRTDRGQEVMERVLGWVPVVRDVRRAAALARFAHTFGLSLASGLGLIECLELSGRASGNRLMVQDCKRLAVAVAEGGTLSEAMKDAEMLTGFSRRLLSAGEQSAEMSKMCGIIARNYDREVKYLTKNMATVIEPVLVVLLAGAVLFLALAIFLPMWDMMALVG